MAHPLPSLTSALPLAQAPALTPLQGIATPALWGWTVAGVLALFALDFLITRRPHEVGTREAVGWSVFYVALPLAFGAWVWIRFRGDVGLAFLSGYVVEKSLSVDNLFVFMLLLGGFAVPRVLQQRVLLIGVAGALALRAVFIAIGALMLARFSITFLVFGLVLLVSAVKVWRDAVRGHDDEPDVNGLAVVRWIRRVVPVTDGYRGTAMVVTEGGRRAATPLLVAVLAILAVDVLFAVDSVPAVFGITDDAYLVFATNAFALMGLRALYFLIAGVLAKLVHLGHGMALILVLISVKLILHWGHTVWPAVPTVPTSWSLALIVLILTLTTITSLAASRRAPGRDAAGGDAPGGVAPGGDAPGRDATGTR